MTPSLTPSAAPARFDVSQRLARHVAGLKPSGIRKFFDLVIGMDDVVSLGVGEPDFPAPEKVRRHGIERLERGQTTYSSNHGTLELRTAIANYLDREFDCHYDPATEVLVTVGASEALDVALRAIINPGDEVIVVEPCFVSYVPTVVMAGGIPVILPTYQKDRYRFDAAALEALITPKTKALFLNYPSNPTGGTLNRDDLTALADVVRRHGLLVIADEIYAELTYDGKHCSLAALPGMKDHTILVSGFSKGWAMTGWRLGYVCAPAALTSQMVKIHQYAIMCAPTLSQYAGVVALEDCAEDVAAMREEYDRRRRLIVDGFNSVGIKTLLPEGAFYAFGSIEDLGFQSSEQFCMELLEAEKVAVVPGNAFGDCGEGMVRASYASSREKIELAVERIGRFLKSRNG
jgi:aminotransferase